MENRRSSRSASLEKFPSVDLGILAKAQGFHTSVIMLLCFIYITGSTRSQERRFSICKSKVFLAIGVMTLLSFFITMIALIRSAVVITSLLWLLMCHLTCRGIFDTVYLCIMSRFKMHVEGKGCHTTSGA